MVMALEERKEASLTSAGVTRSARRWSMPIGSAAGSPWSSMPTAACLWDPTLSSRPASVEERDLQALAWTSATQGGWAWACLCRIPRAPWGGGVQVAVWLSERSPEWNSTCTTQTWTCRCCLDTSWATIPAAHSGSRPLSDRSKTVQPRDAFLQRLVDLRARGIGRKLVGEGDFMAAAAASQYADIHLGLPTTIDRERLMEIRDACGGACLFLLDSGQESTFGGFSTQQASRPKRTIVVYSGRDLIPAVSFFEVCMRLSPLLFALLGAGVVDCSDDPKPIGTAVHVDSDSDADGGPTINPLTTRTRTRT